MKSLNKVKLYTFIVLGVFILVAPSMAHASDTIVTPVLTGDIISSLSCPTAVTAFEVWAATYNATTTYGGHINGTSCNDFTGQNLSSYGGDGDWWISLPLTCTSYPCQPSDDRFYFTYVLLGGHVVSVNGYPVASSTLTRIISLSPTNHTTVPSTGTTTPVNLALHAFVNPDDLGSIIGVKIEFENIDQNILFSTVTQFVGVGNSATLFFGNATTSGDFFFSTTTGLPAGNYRIHATMTKNYFGFLELFKTFDERSSQFIVGTSTWIGGLRQDSFEEADSFFGTLNATSSSAMASTCNPISGTFGIRECLSFLLVPDTEHLKNSMESFRDTFLTRAPWGYITRMYSIFTTDATTTLPVISYTFDPNGPLAGDTWNIDPNDMLAGGAAFLDSVQDPVGHHTIRDVLEPLVKLLVAVAVVFTIFMDLTGSHRHAEMNKQAKLNT